MCITTICLINYTLKYIKTYGLKHEIMVPVTTLEHLHPYKKKKNAPPPPPPSWTFQDMPLTRTHNYLTTLLLLI